MKYIPIDDQIEISRSRSESTGPSLQIDPRGFPHLVWFDHKLNQNEINYSFWDGQQWAFYGDDPLIYTSKNDIFISQNSFILGSYNPRIIFSTKQNDGNSDICLAQRGLSNFNISCNVVDYDIKWIGGIEYSSVVMGFDSSSSSSRDSSSSSSSSHPSTSSESAGNESSSSSSAGTSSSESIGNESSSSSSERTSSSSSSSDKSTSSSSHSSWSSPSSSSSRDSTSSESIGNFSSSSSSSSSIDDSSLFIVTHDGSNDKIKIHSLSELNTLRFVSEISLPLVNPVIKISLGGFYIGVVVLDEDQIVYNFFDLETSQWKHGVFQPFGLSGPVIMPDQESIIDFDIDSYYYEDVAYLTVSWLTKGDSFYVSSGYVTTGGVEKPSDLSNSVVESIVSSEVSTGNYLINGYNSIAVSVVGTFPRIFVSGSASKQFVLDTAREWDIDLIDLEGVSGGNKPRGVVSGLSSSIFHVAFGSHGGIYYFENSLGPSFQLSNSNLLLLTEAETIHVEYQDITLNPISLSTINNSTFGDILKEGKRPVLVTTYDLSSSSSNSSSSSSSSSSYEVVGSESSSSGPHVTCEYCNNVMPYYIGVTFTGTEECISNSGAGCMNCSSWFIGYTRFSHPSIDGEYQLSYDGNCVWSTIAGYSGYLDIDGTVDCTDATRCNYDELKIVLTRLDTEQWRLQAFASNSSDICSDLEIFFTLNTVLDPPYDCLEFVNETNAQFVINECDQLMCAPYSIDGDDDVSYGTIQYLDL